MLEVTEVRNGPSGLRDDDDDNFLLRMLRNGNVSEITNLCIAFGIV